METILTKKVVYVLKALYYLDVVKDNAKTSVLEIAENTVVPKRFLEQLFLRLRKSGLVTSTRGASGGYQLLKRLDELTYRDILEALDGEPPMPTERASGQFGDDAFVRAVYSDMIERTRQLVLGDLIDASMRRKASSGKVNQYVYHI